MLQHNPPKTDANLNGNRSGMCHKRPLANSAGMDRNASKLLCYASPNTTSSEPIMVSGS